MQTSSDIFLRLFFCYTTFLYTYSLFLHFSLSVVCDLVYKMRDIDPTNIAINKKKWLIISKCYLSLFLVRFHRSSSDFSRGNAMYKKKCWKGNLPALISVWFECL